MMFNKSTPTGRSPAIFFIGAGHYSTDGCP
jgi:hypothetical protein